MKQITKKLKKDISLLSTIEERLELLKNKYEGETLYIVSCGPSLKDHDEEELKSKLKNKLVFTIKQAYSILKDVVDFHLLNTYNLSEYKWHDDSIVFWSVSKSYADEQLQRILNINAPIDLYVPVINPPYVNYNQTVQATNNFDEFYRLGKDTEVMFGIGMMYELGLPLALHLGVKDIVTVGWDLGEPAKSTTDWNHFYNLDVGKVTGPASGEIAQKLASTEKLYDWLKDKGINLSILSDKSYVSKKFNRIKLSDID